jgi:hypothetical protein
MESREGDRKLKHKEMESKVYLTLGLQEEN